MLIRLIAFFIALLVAAPAFAQDAAKETAFDRITRTGVIRCGYYVFPPMTYRDPNTGKLTGLSIDMMEEIARRASLKIEWTAEVTWANWIPELQADRFDVACTPMWPVLPMAKAVTFSKAFMYAGLSPVVRQDDARFSDQTTLDRLNQPDVTVLVQEGNATDVFVRKAFPQAQFYTLPASADGSEYYQSLVAKKVDVVVTDLNGLALYEKTNGAHFRMLDTTHPVKLQSFTLASKRGEADLTSFLNLAIDDLYADGEMDRLLRKWEAEPGKTFLRLAPPAALTK